jgi:hypothetical protein
LCSNCAEAAEALLEWFMGAVNPDEVALFREMQNTPLPIRVNRALLAAEIAPRFAVAPRV